MKIFGIDFTSRPTKRKPIVLATGGIRNGTFGLQGFERFESNGQLQAFLSSEPSWVAGFDLPFALPRSLLAHLGWPHLASNDKSAWQIHIEHLQTLTRADMVAAFKAFCNARPSGQKFAHRACDIPAGSSASMKWVNPPVAFMLHAGAPLILDLGVTLPGMHTGHPNRHALEAYPGFVARKVLGARSYKSDDKAKQTQERTLARKELIAALLLGAVESQGLTYPSLCLSKTLKEQMILEASGDHLDAVLCALQAAWGLAHRQRFASNYGLPEHMDALEGWIVSVPAFEPRQGIA